MQNFRNYYAILGVAKEASSDEIKRAFRRLARQYHPDLNPGDKEAEDRFKDIGEAYEVLSDATKRAQYDEYSKFWKQKGFQNARRAAAAGRTWGDRADARTVEKLDYSEFIDFNSFVDRLLSRRGEPAAPPQPGSRDYYRPGTTRTAYTVKPTPARDAEARLTIPLEKAFSGGRERIRLEDGRSLEVNMPPGLVTGQRIRLKNQGINGGDLFLKITVAPHDFFRLEGVDLYCNVPVTPSEAVLGSAIEVPTLDGMVKMNLPRGVRHGQRLRLSNKGYPINRDRRGDQIVEIQIATPTQLSAEEFALYEQLRAIESFDPRANLPVN
jgi:curved DNA-binding protein